MFPFPRVIDLFRSWSGEWQVPSQPRWVLGYVVHSLAAFIVLLASPFSSSSSLSFSLYLQLYQDTRKFDLSHSQGWSSSRSIVTPALSGTLSKMGKRSFCLLVFLPSKPWLTQGLPTPSFRLSPITYKGFTPQLGDGKFSNSINL